MPRYKSVRNSDLRLGQSYDRLTFTYSTVCLACTFESFNPLIFALHLQLVRKNPLTLAMGKMQLGL